MDEIEDIVTFTLSDKDECCKTYEKCIDFLSNIVPQRGGILYFTGTGFNLLGRCIFLFKYKGKLIAKGIVNETINQRDESSKYTGYYIVEENSIEIFKSQISLNDLNEYSAK